LVEAIAVVAEMYEETKKILEAFCGNKHRIVFQIPTYCTIYLLDKTHVKIRTSKPLKFFNITLLHVSILPDHHQGVIIGEYSSLFPQW
jgi:hypothetical protein